MVPSTLADAKVLLVTANRTIACAWWHSVCFEEDFQTRSTHRAFRIKERQDKNQCSL